MDENGNTALHYAAYIENLEIAKKLLSHNADIEGRNKVWVNFFKQFGIHFLTLKYLESVLHICKFKHSLYEHILK